MKVSDLMTRQVTAFRSDTPILEAADRMIELGVRHFPVVDRGCHVVGIVSARDMRGAPHVELDSIMTKPALTIGPDAGVGEAARVMRGQHIGCLPVVVDGCLVGILSERDCLKALAR